MPYKEFDSCDLHDSLVHGVSFLTEGFIAELHLDIDYILQWPTCVDESPVFEVSKALVRFCDVSDLSIDIEWPKKGPETALSRIFIDKVIRHEVSTTLRLPAYYKWRILMSDGRSSISFGASDMIIELVGSPATTNRQYLMSYERG